MVWEKWRMANSLAKYQIIVFTCIFVGHAVYILCRKSFGFIIPAFLESEKLSKEDSGIIVSSLNTAYAISKFVIGILSDQVSARLLIFAGLTISSFTVIGFSRVQSVPIYAFLWFMNGLAQGCAWPACVKILRKWFKPSQFGTVWSLLSVSANVTGAVVPLFLPLLVNGASGWRSFMLMSGTLGVAIAFSTLVAVKDNPTDYGLPEITTEPKKKDENKNIAATPSGSKWSILLRSAFLWRLSCYYFVVFVAKTSCENWSQLLILEEKKLSINMAGGFVSSFEMGGMAGSIVTGYITDWMLLRQAHEKRQSNPRMRVAMGYMLVSVVALIMIASMNILLPILAFLLGASLYGNINIFGIVAVEEAPVHLSGSSHAVVGLAANVGAILAGYPISVLATSTSLTFTFNLQAFACFVCLLAMLVTRSSTTKIAHMD